MKGSDCVPIASQFRSKLAVGLAAVAAGIGLLSTGSSALGKEPLGRVWLASQQIPMDRIDHSRFDALLRKYVDADGYVNYQGWQRSTVDRQALQQYLSELGRASMSQPTSVEGQLAFWINAYNAVTLEGILQVYPTDSIRNHTARIVGYNIWDDLPLVVGGTPVSLNDIEHNILRKMGEPRIHFAIVCASVGCPRLLNEAYVANRLNEQLASNATDFFSREQNFMVDSSGTMHLSAILDWFGEDFGSSQAQRMTRVQPYLPRQYQELAINPQTRVKFRKYNWSLNDQSRKPPEAEIRSAGGRR